MYKRKVPEGQAKREPAMAKVEAVETKLTIAQDEANAAIAANETRAMKLTAHKLALANHAVKSRTKRLTRVEENIAQAEAAVIRLSTEIEGDKVRISGQEQKILQAKVARAQAQTQIKAQAAARLSAKKAQSKKAEEARVAAAVKPVAVTAAPEQKAETVVLDQEALAYARKEFKKFDGITDEERSKRPPLRKVMVKLSGGKAKAMEYVGRKLYRADVKVSKGKQVFHFGKRKFTRTIPAVDDGATYVLVYDVKKLTRPRFALFNKSLLDHL